MSLLSNVVLDGEQRLFLCKMHVTDEHGDFKEKRRRPTTTIVYILGDVDLSTLLYNTTIVYILHVSKRLQF
jgi:hypothetical protein